MSTFRIEVRVMPRAALLDPQGQAVEHALHALGFGEVARVRMGQAPGTRGEAASRDESPGPRAGDVRPAAREPRHRRLRTWPWTEGPRDETRRG